MTLYDSSVLIEYLDGNDDVVSYVESHLDERAVTPPLALFEVYQGEIFKNGPTNLDAVDGALEWVTTVETAGETARAAGELQDELRNQGQPLAARDAFIAGASIAHDELLVVADADFEVAALTNLLEVTFL
ncbi:PIN domain-containing protein [Natronococcus occultus]|uniref:Putative nucleic acid-binding protein, contains PIN domain n=1 Tax=Natronococcus occultus SP4 TaxID=694430 RepID=L0K592_9EURY|nr:PIN domain-containing protein [Natronococcus occultus]AGB39715.1 putative nucleic acid-binding protein, contains PIN domain [Natronococcus occultus SP4]